MSSPVAVPNALHTHTGGTDAKTARLIEAALIVPTGASSLAARTGVLIGPGSRTLLTGTSSTAPMRTAIAAHHWITTRGTAEGVYRGVLATAATVDHDPAPGSGTRIDLVYEKQRDETPGIPTPDPAGTTGPLYGVVKGLVGQGKPDLPVGANELGTVTISAGAIATNGANVTIANTARQTNTRGGIIPVSDQAERVALQTAGFTFPTMQVLELDKGRRLWHDGTRFRYEGDRVAVANAAERAQVTVYVGLQARESDTRRTFEWDGTRWQYVGGNTPAVMARRTSPQGGLVLTAAAWTAYPFQELQASETTDASMWSAVNPTRLVAPIDGMYSFVGIIAFSAAAGSRYLAARKNGVGNLITRGPSGNLAANPGANELQVVTQFRLLAGEYVELLYFVSAAETTPNSAGVEFSPRGELRWVGTY